MNEEALTVYGVSVSYYTGKLEAYLRYKQIPYSMKSPFAQAKRVREHAGAVQVPIIERPDGRWMSDSTPILASLDAEVGGASIYPEDEVVRFIALLIEDYADEWLWRCAMHYRWSYEHDRALLSRILTDEIMGHVKAPRFLKLRSIAKRQRTSFVLKDGVTDTTQAHVEAGYRAALANMTRMLSERRFLLGDAPSIADFGLMGPMLRHFGQDPTPQEIMRNEGPAVYAWVARVWNTVQSREQPSFLSAVPIEATPMLKEICETHLVQLAANADGFASGASHFEMNSQGCHYPKLPVSRYRVWCLEQLRHAYTRLSDTSQSAVQALLPYEPAAVLWRNDSVASSRYDEAGEAPYNQAINVYGHGTPD